MQRISQEPEKERKKKSWSYSLHILCRGKAETMTVSWVDFCTWHIMLNPFINHRKTCLLCSLIKNLNPCHSEYGTGPFSVGMGLPTPVTGLTHQSSSKCSSPGHKSSPLLGFMRGMRGLRLFQVSGKSNSCYTALTSSAKMPSDRDLF